MPNGPIGPKRPADAIGLAVMMGKIATGEVEDQTDPLPEFDMTCFKEAVMGF